jgi:K+-transporting ATPase ATPase A chain
VERFVLSALALAVAGLFARQARRPTTYATLPTASWTFAGMLIGVIAVIGGVSYFIAWSLGPVAEHLSGAKPEPSWMV